MLQCMQAQIGQVCGLTVTKNAKRVKPPFVNEGDRVVKGQVLCIIESMKIMNEIECEQDGLIKKVLVKNSDPVEFNQPLFIID